MNPTENAGNYFGIYRRCASEYLAVLVVRLGRGAIRRDFSLRHASREYGRIGFTRIGIWANAAPWRHGHRRGVTTIYFSWRVRRLKHVFVVQPANLEPADGKTMASRNRKHNRFHCGLLRVDRAWMAGFC